VRGPRATAACGRVPSGWRLETPDGQTESGQGRPLKLLPPLSRPFPGTDPLDVESNRVGSFDSSPYQQEPCRYCGGVSLRFEAPRINSEVRDGASLQQGLPQRREIGLQWWHIAEHNTWSVPKEPKAISKVGRQCSLNRPRAGDGDRGAGGATHLCPRRATHCRYCQHDNKPTCQSTHALAPCKDRK